MEKKLAKLKSATVIQEPKQVSLKAGSSVKQTGGIQASSNKTGKTTVPVQQPLKMVLFVFVFFYLCDISSCIALFLLHFIIFLLYCCIVEKEKEVSSSVESNQPSRSVAGVSEIPRYHLRQSLFPPLGVTKCRDTPPLVPLGILVRHFIPIATLVHPGS